MKALVVTKNGPPDVLQVQEWPEPRPGPGQVRVRVRAAGVNFADLLARAGLYPDAPKPPCVVGYEFAGELETGAEGLVAGQRVMGASRFGGQAEIVATDANAIVPLPDGWSFEEGASFSVTYPTAYAALLRYGGLRQGERVLIHAAAGGVGTAATQIAKAVGAEVFGTASRSKHEGLRELGVDHPIDYRGDEVVGAVRRMAGSEQPLDLVLDGLGGRSFRDSFKLLRAGGRLVCIGASSVAPSERRSYLRALRLLAETPRFNPFRLLRDSKAVIGVNMLALWDAGMPLEDLVVPLRRWLDEGRLHPVVAQSFPLERGADAHRMMHQRQNVGKVVLSL